ncbi:uncharacterized protein LOC107470862 [Arachis duranensis]|uniref:Uncharacterized protein LOC107470862 n=1 Tax=Arachis duranensis TaxID=130453 RepID=A0A9C6U020_ARADU|nr:uncharacterized protein LOC107470862 [Arachis duranensis]
MARRRGNLTMFGLSISPKLCAFLSLPFIGDATGVMENMKFIPEVLLLSLTIILLQSSIIFARQYENSNHIKTATFYSEQFVLEPGKVTITDLFDIEFPRGHIGIKNFQAELVDEHRNSLPLYEAYLHHYFVLRYFENVTMSRQANQSQPIYGKYFRRNDGVCQGSVNSYSWGLGVDARKTSLELPDPFRIEVGTHPENVPKEYNEEKWLFDIMVIDTRGTEDKNGCIECRCDHYNVKSEDFVSKTGIDGKPMSGDYKGGIFCCEKTSQCKLQKGYNNKQQRKASLKYTVTWVDWDQYQVPIKFYILDVTDQVTYNGSESIHNCMVEYFITPQNTDIGHYHIKKTKIPMKKGGNLIYSTVHVHPGIVNATLYGENGKVLCAVQPTYGTGEEPGNEKGYVVGMSGCYPKPGSIKIQDGEILTVEFIHENKYNTGLMGHFYVYLAEELP